MSQDREAGSPFIEPDPPAQKAGVESAFHPVDDRDATARATTRTMRRTVANLDAATTRLLDSENMRRTVANLETNIKTWATLDPSTLTQSWAMHGANVAFHDVEALVRHEISDAVKRDPHSADQVVGLPAPLADGATATPTLLLVLLAASPALADAALEGVLPILEMLLFGLRLLGVLANLDLAVSGALLLMTLVGMILAVLPKADHQ